MRNKMLRRRGAERKSGRGGRRIVQGIQSADSSVGDGYDETLHLKMMTNTMGG
jgi:hypothetical protein